MNTLKKNALTVAVAEPFYPFAYKHEGVWTGFEVEFLRAFCAEHGLALRFAKWPATALLLRRRPPSYGTPPPPRVPDAQIADVLLGGSTVPANAIPDADLAAVTYTVPYAVVRRTILSARDAPVRRFPDDLVGSVSGRMGSTGFADAVRRIRSKFRTTRAAWRHIVRDEEVAWSRGRVDETALVARLLRDGAEIGATGAADGRVQGVMRGDLSSRAWARRFPDRLVVSEAWDADERRAEVVAFRCATKSRVAPYLSAFVARRGVRTDLDWPVRVPGLEPRSRPRAPSSRPPSRPPAPIRPTVAALRLKRRGALTAVVRADTYPFAYRHRGAWTGCEVEFLRAFCALHGLKLVVRRRSVSRQLKDYRDRREPPVAPCEQVADVVLGGHDDGAWARAYGALGGVAYTAPYARSHTVVVSSRDAGPVDLRRLAGTFAVPPFPRFEDADAQLRVVLALGPENVRWYPDEREAVENVLGDDGVHDLRGFVCHSAAAEAYARAYRGRLVASEPLDAPVGLALKCSAYSRLAEHLSAFAATRPVDAGAPWPLDVVADARTRR